MPQNDVPILSAMRCHNLISSYQSHTSEVLLAFVRFLLSFFRSALAPSSLPSPGLWLKVLSCLPFVGTRLLYRNQLAPAEVNGTSKNANSTKGEQILQPCFAPDGTVVSYGEVLSPMSNGGYHRESLWRSSNSRCICLFRHRVSHSGFYTVQMVHAWIHRPSFSFCSTPNRWDSWT